MFKKKVFYMMFGAIAALVLVFGAAATFAQTAAVQDGGLEETTDELPTADSDHLLHGRDRLVDSETYEQFMADALGITVEELQAAYEAAREAAVEQALVDGLITQEQADVILSGEKGFSGRGRSGRAHSGPDGDEFLAEALGITVEVLESARNEARAAAIEQAVEDGTITAEQAELIAATDALKDYIDRDALLADVLGVSVDEVVAAKEAGTLRELVDDSGISAEEFQAAMQAAHEAAVAQAVVDGIITQEQADQLEAGAGLFGGRCGHGGRGRPGSPSGGLGPAQGTLPGSVAPAAGA